MVNGSWLIFVSSTQAGRPEEKISVSLARRTAAVLTASGITALSALAPALPAMAHGATTQPVSRTAACAARSDDADSAACRAARKANGRPFGSFDNLRVPGVNGKRLAAQVVAAPSKETR